MILKCMVGGDRSPVDPCQVNTQHIIIEKNTTHINGFIQIITHVDLTRLIVFTFFSLPCAISI